MQVSCVNPDGSTASHDGWSTFGTAQAGVSASTQCGPGSPMVALVSDAAPVAGSTVVGLQYTAPSGSALSGGAVEVNLDADGTGITNGGYNGAEGQAGVLGPALGFDAGNVITQCVDGNPQAFAPCSNGTDDFAGTVAIPDRGGGVWVEAACGGVSNATCNTGGRNGAWATAKLIASDLLLTNGSTPQAANFSGSVLQPNASGTAHLVFTATDPSGPGVYQVSAAIDGTPVYTGTPDTNGGECVATGTDPATGSWMFGYAQPCRTTEVVDIPVPTTGVADGAHELTATVTDAAHNSSTVFDQSISVSNPVTTTTTPKPAGPGSLHAQFVIKWHWLRAATEVRKIRVAHLPGNARVTVRCVGKHCPRLRARARGIRRVGAMLDKLVGRHLRPGQSLLLAVTAPQHTPERIALVIRYNRKPLAKLLRR